MDVKTSHALLVGFPRRPEGHFLTHQMGVRKGERITAGRPPKPAGRKKSKNDPIWSRCFGMAWIQTERENRTTSV